MAETLTKALLSLGVAVAFACGKSESRDPNQGAVGDTAHGGAVAAVSGASPVTQGAAANAGASRGGAGSGGGAGAIASAGDATAGADAETAGAGGAVELPLPQQPTFEAPRVAPKTTSPGFGQAIAAGDLDGDGDVDLALAIDLHGAAVLLGNGDGTFAPSVDYAAWTAHSDAFPFGISMADLDGDHDLDLAVGNELQGAERGVAGVLTNDGKGSFGQLQELALTGPGTMMGAVASADFDGDGRMDLVSASYGTTNVFSNDAKGSFRPAQKVAQSGQGAGQGLAVGDLNGDGATDLVVTRSKGEKPLDVFLNAGAGAFLPLVSYAASAQLPTEPASLVGVVVADLDADGDLDIVASNETLKGVSIFWNSGDGTFSAPLLVPTGGAPWAVGVGDLNGDTYPEIVAANFTSPSVVVLVNDGHRRFSAGKPLAQGSFSRAIALADFNGDGRLDVATGSQSFPNVNVWLNTTAP